MVAIIAVGKSIIFMFSYQSVKDKSRQTDEKDNQKQSDKADPKLFQPTYQSNELAHPRSHLSNVEAHLNQTNSIMKQI